MRSAWVVFAVLAIWCGCVGFAQDQVGKCRRTPSDTTAPKEPGDNGFKIKISGNPEKYVPGEVYTVSLEGLRTQYTVRKFTGFKLVAEASPSTTDFYGSKSVGFFQLYGDALTRHSPNCEHAVIHASSSPKSDIQMMWTAPPAGSGCVVFRATVQQTRDTWYMDDGELTKELCEDVQESDDKQPEVIQECCACDEAKYEVTFEGLWSRHTHPKDFPSNEWLTHFSDIIGASHSAGYRVWEYGGYSSDGLRQVAEWGSTRLLESELKAQSDHIRTIIKARGLWYPNVTGKTFAVFRVDNRHHLMSLVSMLGPSPDWIVGVSALELCLKNCSWVDQKMLNLYPWDAGTDSGVTYESHKSPSMPRQKIRRITNSYPNDSKSPFHGLPMKPLARLTITRQRVYEKSCSDPTIYAPSFSTLTDDDDASRPECAMGPWSQWSQCSATCGKGLRSRSRAYVMPVKASMMGCNRQDTMKEMCAAAEDFCPGGGNPFSSEDDLRICATTDWSPWGHCSATCGKGIRLRSRRYLDRMGRKKCRKDTTDKEMCVADIMECTGVQEEEIPPGCEVTPWTEWSPCSVTCGEGVSSRARQYLIPMADLSNCSVTRSDKRSCYGERLNCTFSPKEREEVCSQEREPGPCRAYFRRWYFDIGSYSCKEFAYGGCRGNRNNFLTPDECMKTCGTVKVPTEPGYLRITDPFNPHSDFGNDPENTYNEVEKIDCMVTDWSDWGPCSVTCGKGKKEKRRMIKVHPQNGGKRCPKKLIKKRKCTAPKCNNHFSGLESLSLRREEPVVPFEYRQPEKQFAPTHYGDYHEYIAPALYNPPITDDHHLLQPPESRSYFPEEEYDDGTKSDCVMGEWGPWTPCTHSCGGEALQQRSRIVIVEPRNGGTPCGEHLERRYCTLPPCPHTRG